MMAMSLHGPESMNQAAEALLPLLHSGQVVFLEGDLGAGKTTLVRCICELLGTEDLVSSPSFSVVNVYRTRRFPVAHFDLYRLHDAGDLEDIGAEDFLTGEYLVFVEWPSQAPGFFMEPDFRVRLDITADGASRELEIRQKPASTDAGEAI